MPYTADRRLYHNADRSRIVEEGDPDAAYLLVAEGAELPDAEAKRLGLDAVKAKSKPAETKRVEGPPEDKSGNGRRRRPPAGPLTATSD